MATASTSPRTEDTLTFSPFFIPRSLAKLFAQFHEHLRFGLDKPGLPSGHDARLPMFRDPVGRGDKRETWITGEVLVHFACKDLDRRIDKLSWTWRSSEPGIPAVRNAQGTDRR